MPDAGNNPRHNQPQQNLNMNTKAQILKAAEDLFFRKGYHATTIRNIAAEASVNNAMVNYYFQSKENLYLAVLQQLQKSFDTVHPPVDNGRGQTETLELFIRQTIEVCQKHDKLFHLFMQEQLQASTPQTAEMVKNIEKNHFECFCSILKSHHNYKASVPDSCTTLKYHAIFGMVKEFIRIENNKMMMKAAS